MRNKRVYHPEVEGPGTVVTLSPEVEQQLGELLDLRLTIVGVPVGVNDPPLARAPGDVDVGVLGVARAEGAEIVLVEQLRVDHADVLLLGLWNGPLKPSVLETAARMGARDLMWFPSASFPCQAGVIDLMERGVVHHIEGSMNGPLGNYCSTGKMRGMGVLRSHGGRWQAIQDGDVHIDIAVIAAPGWTGGNAVPTT